MHEPIVGEFSNDYEIKCEKCNEYLSVYQFSATEYKRYGGDEHDMYNNFNLFSDATYNMQL